LEPGGLQNNLPTPLCLQIATFVAVRLAFNTMHRMVYPFLSHFARGLGVDLSALSAALTARSLAGFFSPLLAWVADRHGRRAGMLFGLLLYTLGVGAVVAWPTYPAFFLALVLTGVGYLVYIPSMQAYLGDRVAYAQRGLVMALTELAWSLSAILGVPLMGLLIGRAGWLAPFPLLAVLALLSMLVLARLLPKDSPGPQLQAGLWANLRRIFTYPPALAGLGMVACYSAANECITLSMGCGSSSPSP
jgi:predicted MFS family arabinose efflux permease